MMAQIYPSSSVPSNNSVSLNYNPIYFKGKKKKDIPKPDDPDPDPDPTLDEGVFDDPPHPPAYPPNRPPPIEDYRIINKPVIPEPRPVPEDTPNLPAKYGIRKPNDMTRQMLPDRGMGNIRDRQDISPDVPDSTRRVPLEPDAPQDPFQTPRSIVSSDPFQTPRSIESTPFQTPRSIESTPFQTPRSLPSSSNPSFNELPATELREDGMTGPRLPSVDQATLESKTFEGGRLPTRPPASMLSRPMSGVAVSEPEGRVLGVGRAIQGTRMTGYGQVVHRGSSVLRFDTRNPVWNARQASVAGEFSNQNSILRAASNSGVRGSMNPFTSAEGEGVLSQAAQGAESSASAGADILAAGTAEGEAAASAASLGAEALAGTEAGEAVLGGIAAAIIE